MLGPILQGIANQVGPLLNQLFQAAEPILQQIPRHVYIIGARVLSQELQRVASSWYHSLSPDAKARVDRAIAWAIKDLTGDVITSSTGLPLKRLVNSVFDLVEEYRNVPAARDYVETRLKMELVELAEQSKDEDRAKPYVSNERLRRVEKPPLPEGCDLSKIGDKDPCPCGSGKRYENCHGFVR